MMMNMMQMPQMFMQQDAFSQAQQLPTLEQLNGLNDAMRQQTVYNILTLKTNGFIPADKQAYTQKIVALIGDLGTFKVEDVYKLFENPQELAKSVNQAIEVIEESQ